MFGRLPNRGDLGDLKSAPPFRRFLLLPLHFCIMYADVRAIINNIQIDFTSTKFTTMHNLGGRNTALPLWSTLRKPFAKMRRFGSSRVNYLYDWMTATTVA